MNKINEEFKKDNRFKNFLKEHATSIIYLVILTVIVSVITYYRVLVQMEIGPVSDSFDFLSNALVFAGHGTGYSDLLRPPFFSFIISLFFRLGYTYASTIFIVDGILFVFGVIGMFLLLKTKFNDLQSFLGGLLYSTFTAVLLVLGFGFSDLASVSFTIWALYFLVLAVERNYNYFYLVFPFAMFAFLTRYNNALLIFPIFLYILINRNRINFKHVYAGISVSVLVLIPVLIFFYETFDNIIYPFLNFGSTSTESSTSVVNIAYNTNIFYFMQNFINFVGIQGVIVLLIVAGFVILYLLKKLVHIPDYKNILYDKNGVNQRILQMKYIILAVLIIIFLGSFGKIVYLITELMFFGILYLFYDITKNLNIKNYDTHILIFAWFMAFFIFQSIYVLKNNRYFVLMAPPVAYFMILSLNGISDRVRFRIRKINLLFPFIAIMLTSVILLSTATEIPQILQANNNVLTLNEQIELTSQWFVNYDPDYKDQIISSDLSPNFSWYLKTNVSSVPIFVAYQTLPDGNRIYLVTQADNKAINEYLTVTNADYFICEIPGINLANYKPIKKFSSIVVYKKT